MGSAAALRCGKMHNLVDYEVLVEAVCLVDIQENSEAQIASQLESRMKSGVTMRCEPRHAEVQAMHRGG